MSEKKIIDFNSLFSFTPNIDYDKAFFYVLCTIAALGAGIAVNKARDLKACREYGKALTNEEYIKTLE